MVLISPRISFLPLRITLLRFTAKEKKHWENLEFTRLTQSLAENLLVIAKDQDKFSNSQGNSVRFSDHSEQT